MIQRGFNIHYWPKEMLVEFVNLGGQQIDITITNDGDFFIEVDGEYYGPGTYYHGLLTYDLIGLLYLYKEVYHGR